MTAKKKIAQKRLPLLQLVERLRNVSEACRHHGVSRSQFYESKRAFQERGLEGLVDRPPIPKSCPHETPPELRGKIVSLSLEHPARGLFLSHDIGANKAFFDFMKEKGIAWKDYRIFHVLGGFQKRA